MMHFHILKGHGGRNLTLAATREEFSLARKCVFNCSYCKLQRIKPSPPMMSDLPIERLMIGSPPFTATGIDYFGPLYVKQGRRTRNSVGTAKRYGSLFTCMTTRAVHLELAGDLSTDSFLMAFRRFTSRRGRPKIVWSDNGTNFVGAERELREALQRLDQHKIRKELANVNIDWNFNPPASPWMGGVWESLVKITKKSLKAVVRDRMLHEDALTTVLCEVESILNSRPLTEISDDVNDFEALTPNHILITRSNPNLYVGGITEKDLSSRVRWRAVQAISDMFWKRWVS